MKQIITILLMLFLAACNTQQKTDTNSKLAGMYKLLIIEMQDSSGIWHEQEWSKGGDSYIVYDGLGHMAVQITPKDYKDFNWMKEEETINKDILKQKVDSMSQEQLRAALMEFASNYAYVANYSINDSESVITHNRLSHTIPSAWNTSVKRKYEFKGDTIFLQVLEVKRRLTWIRQK
jgi:hypothetical protein